MKKYWQVFKTSVQLLIMYRINFVMWRFRNVSSFLMMYFLWYSATSSQTLTFGYTQNSMLTYVFAVAIVRAFVLSSRTVDIADDISTGNLSMYLLRPVNYITYYFTQDVADKLANFLFAVCELTILFIIFRPPLFFQTDPWLAAVSVGLLLLAIIMYFFINLLLSFMAFWIPENTWGPRFLFMITLEFFAGGLFPIDILPKGVQAAFHLTPFPYLLYFPVSAYLGKLTGYELAQGTLIALGWLGVLYIMTLLVWKRGLRSYDSAGR